MGYFQGGGIRPPIFGLVSSNSYVLEKVGIVGEMYKGKIMKKWGRTSQLIGSHPSGKKGPKIPFVSIGCPIGRGMWGIFGFSDVYEFRGVPEPYYARNWPLPLTGRGFPPSSSQVSGNNGFDPRKRSVLA